MKQLITISLAFILVLGIFQSLNAQRILLDKPVRAGQLTLFPEVENQSEYYYLPDKPQLALNDQGQSHFSFTRYVKNEMSDGSSAESILDGSNGGGLIHALVQLSVTDDMIKEAERALRRIDGDGKIVGPVVFKSGTVALVSAIAQENGDMTEQIVGLGAAPILENQKSAVAVQLNPIGSKILWETFNTSTPDFSFNFEMEVEGYLSPKRVLIEADFDRVYKHRLFDAGVSGNVGEAVLAAEIQTAYDELFDQGAIKVTQIGEDEELDKIKETAYNQLTSLMFDKIGGSGVPNMNELFPGGGKKSMLDRATENLASARKEAMDENKRIEGLTDQMRKREGTVRNGARERRNTRRPGTTAPQGSQARTGTNSQGEGGLTAGDIPKKVPVPSLSVAVSYKQKTLKRSGKYTIDLNKYTQEIRSMPFAYNPGNVKSQCRKCFLEVNLEDPLMQQREINASLGGINTTDFDYINFVNIIMKKKHENGDETVRELKIDKSKFNADGNLFRMLYGWKGDNDRDDWLNYDYRTMWSYAGGYSEETDWENTEFGSIALNPTVIKKPVYVEIDEDFVLDEEIRGIEIKFYSKLGDSENIKSINLKTRNAEELSTTVELLLPLAGDDFEYDVTYFQKGKDPQSSQRKSTNYGRIDIDRIL